VRIRPINNEDTARPRNLREHRTQATVLHHPHLAKTTAVIALIQRSKRVETSPADSATQDRTPQKMEFVASKMDFVTSYVSAYTLPKRQMSRRCDAPTIVIPGDFHATSASPAPPTALETSHPPHHLQLERDSSAPVAYSVDLASSGAPPGAPHPYASPQSPQLDDVWYQREEAVGEVPDCFTFAGLKGIEICPDPVTPSFCYQAQTPMEATCSMWSPMYKTRSAPELSTPTWAKTETPAASDERPWFLSPMARHGNPNWTNAEIRW